MLYGKSQFNKQCVAYLVGLLAVNLMSCQTIQKGKMMGSEEDRKKILQIITNYTVAGQTGNTGLWESLFWLDELGFTVIENDRPHVMGRKHIDFLTGISRERGPQPNNQKWYDTQVYFVSTDIAYTVSLCDEFNINKTSRVTLLFKKKHDEWRIIHGHFSFVPE